MTAELATEALEHITGPNGSALQGIVFWFNGTMILHRGIYCDREVAARLQATFAAEGAAGDTNAQACADQLAEAIRQHDEYWTEEKAA